MINPSHQRIQLKYSRKTTASNQAPVASALIALAPLSVRPNTLTPSTKHPRSFTPLLAMFCFLGGPNGPNDNINETRCMVWYYSCAEDTCDSKEQSSV